MARRPDVFGDPFSYLRHAEDIAAGRGYATWIYAKPTAYFPVGYPAVLGGALWLMGRVASSATAFQAVIVVNMAAVAADDRAHLRGIAQRVADRRVARLAAGLVAIFPGLVLYGAVAYVESFFTALVLLLAWLAFCGRDLVPACRGSSLGLALGRRATDRVALRPRVPGGVAAGRAGDGRWERRRWWPCSPRSSSCRGASAAPGPCMAWCSSPPTPATTSAPATRPLPTGISTPGHQLLAGLRRCRTGAPRGRARQHQHPRRARRMRCTTRHVRSSRPAQGVVPHGPRPRGPPRRRLLRAPT